MKKWFKKIFNGIGIGIGIFLSIFALDKIFNPRLEIVFTNNSENKEESE